MKPDLEALYRAALAEADDNELRAIEWWARGSKGAFEWHHSARKALADALAQKTRAADALEAAL